MPIEVFPIILTRIAGCGIHDLHGMDFKQCLNHINEWVETRNLLERKRQSISDYLYKRIPEITDPEARYAVIAMRRDIFNAREITADSIASIEAGVSAPVLEKIGEYENLYSRLKSAKISGEREYANDINQADRVYDQLTRSPLFLSGLLLSSEELYRARHERNKKTAVGLTRYLSRMCAKTTPFGAFTHLDMVNESGQPVGGKPGINSHVRLNNNLYHYLQGLLFSNREISLWFTLVANPTIEIEGEKYRFLTNFNNAESFQRIRKTESLDYIYGLIQTHKGGLRLKDFIDDIIHTKKISAGRDDIENYLRQLIEYGFFEFDLGVSGTDTEWDIKLRGTLAPIAENIPLVGDLAGALSILRDSAVKYGKGDLSVREGELAKAYNAFRDICKRLHMAAKLPEEELLSFENPKRYLDLSKKKFGKPGKNEKAKEDAVKIFKHAYKTAFFINQKEIFYEDVSTKAKVDLDFDTVKKAIAGFDTIMRAVWRFEGRAEERLRMFLYFKDKYENRQQVSILTFYEDYYRDVIHAKDKSGKRYRNPPEILALRRRNKAWLRRTADRILKSNTAEGAVIIQPGHLGRFPSQWVQPVSIGAFIQSGRDGMIFSNGPCPGYGKMVSRFLHLFDDSVTGAIRKMNETLKPGGAIFAENSDASVFNANLHPPLLPHEIVIPNGNHNMPEENRIPVTDIDIGCDAVSGSLYLVHRHTKRRIHPFDIGFQGHRGRSPLFRLLDQFTLHLYMGPYLLLNAINVKIRDPKKNQEEIAVYPRIMFGDNLVLQRKFWTIPISQVPVRGNGESEFEYILRLNTWRKKLGMPREVFIRMRRKPRSGKRNKGKEVKDKGFRTLDYKPQYICFDNPYLLRLFVKMTAIRPDILDIEEMAPASDNLLKVDGSPAVTEFVVHWTSGKY